jgi:pimeloyl-ACP methyl ester carboxylesterase
MYPEDVAGMVLIDSAHEDEPIRAPKFFLARTAPGYLRYPLHLLLETAVWTGALRFLAPQPKGLHNATRQQFIRALRQQPKSIATDISTGVMVSESYKEAHELATTGNRPLIVMTAGRPQPWQDPEMGRQAAAYQQVWIHEIQAQLTRLSSRGRQIVVEDSGHGIPDEAPQTVISAIREVVVAARAQPR